MCEPSSTHNEAPLLKQRFFVTTITKIKRFVMGALVGALIPTFFNETKWKQHLNRGYDSESGHHLSFFMPPYKSLCVCNSISWRKNLSRYVLIYPFVSGKFGVRLRVVQFDERRRPSHGPE
ncbi:hypothetical protein DDT52_16195 [Brenneria roseae subsp. roseae]|nr:hypothetical protein DDT52_16195 [Brenneria roseae subsp. roseae]